MAVGDRGVRRNRTLACGWYKQSLCKARCLAGWAIRARKGHALSETGRRETGRELQSDTNARTTEGNGEPTTTYRSENLYNMRRRRLLAAAASALLDRKANGTPQDMLGRHAAGGSSVYHLGQICRWLKRRLV